MVIVVFCLLKISQQSFTSSFRENNIRQYYFAVNFQGRLVCMGNMTREAKEHDQGKTTPEPCPHNLTDSGLRGSIYYTDSWYVLVPPPLLGVGCVNKWLFTHIES